MIYDKVLIAAPIHEYKNYCIRDWLKYVCTGLTYPKGSYEVMVVDNSEDRNWHKEFIGLYSNLRVERYQKARESEMTVQQVLAECQNKMVNYAKKNKFDSLFSHECDNKAVDPDIIEKLQAHDLPVVGGFYQHGFGEKRYHMIQKLDNPIHQTRLVTNRYRLLEFEETVSMINGKLHEVGNIGIGALLIQMWVFKFLKFHSDEKGQGLSDSYFFADLMSQLGIEAYCDTSVNVKHENDSWGYKGVIERMKGKEMDGV